jgi:hypothetical protein
MEASCQVSDAADVLCAVDHGLFGDVKHGIFLSPRLQCRRGVAVLLFLWFPHQDCFDAVKIGGVKDAVATAPEGIRHAVFRNKRNDFAIFVNADGVSLVQPINGLFPLCFSHGSFPFLPVCPVGQACCQFWNL